jgi:microcystin degradation protein MlrC
MRIAVGGFAIESSTFSPHISREADFMVLRGELAPDRYEFLSKFEGVETTPLLLAFAMPGGAVDRQFYELIKTELLDGLRAHGPWDGVFLHMHGAANVVDMDDAEGDFIAVVREVVGPDCPISASYDLHGNVSQRVFDSLDILSAYRTAPHVDRHETLERAFSLLVECVRSEIKPHKVFIPVPILLPGEQTSTEWAPADGLYSLIPEVTAHEGVMDASILVGYVWADEPRASATVLTYGTDQDAVQQAATQLAQRFWDVRREFRFGVPAGSVDDCIHAAMRSTKQPVVISDSGDNPTAGGVGDVPYTLGRLIALQVPDAVFASITDSETVAICKAAGEGAQVDLQLGGKLDPVNGKPLAVSGQVVTVKTVPQPSSGPRRAQDENTIAVVQIGGVKCIVTERRTAYHRIADFEQLGIDPTAHKIIVVKIGYLVPELKSLAAEALLALSPGAVNQNITQLPFKHINRPMFPFDEDMTWAPPEASYGST